MALDLDQLQESPNLLDILIQMEDVLDSMDVYVFKNWLKGEIVEGPNVRRYWLDMTLLYPYDSKSKDHGMPDPKAALRLLKHGVRVDYDRGRYENESDDPKVLGEEDDHSEDDENLVWLLRVSIPRRLVVQMAAAQHDFYDDEVDIEQVEDAKDDGMDDETGYMQGEQDGLGGPQSPEGGPEAPGGPGGAPPPPGGPGQGMPL